MTLAKQTIVTPALFRGPLGGKRIASASSPTPDAPWTPAQGRGDEVENC
jgi:hypothetical protein